LITGIKEIYVFGKPKNGMIFGASNSDNNHFYVLSITTNGWYTIYKYFENRYIVIKEWENTSRLNTGFNTINTLRVDRVNTTYSVYLNGNRVYQFTDTEIIGDRIGFWVEIGSAEDELFPGVPVDVRFRIKT
jgi:hypothetical protein